MPWFLKSFKFTWAAIDQLTHGLSLTGMTEEQKNVTMCKNTLWT